MSGHSKWSTIKRAKGVADNKRGQIFTKLGREISVAARQGGGDPEVNARLRLAIDRARDANMPKDNMERAIKRGTGEDADAAQLEEVIYEGYGPGGTAILVEALTDNRNRTASDVRAVLDGYVSISPLDIAMVHEAHTLRLQSAAEALSSHLPRQA